MLDYKNCTALNDYTSYDDDSNDPKSPDFNFGQKTCIAINDLTLLD